MAKKYDGGMAFPIGRVHNANGEVAMWEESGMSLRDWFAGHALAGLLPAWVQDGAILPDPPRAAQYAYALADAMLAERQKAEANP